MSMGYEPFRFECPTCGREYFLCSICGKRYDIYADAINCNERTRCDIKLTTRTDAPSPPSGPIFK